jgi:hypothetical protein
MFAFFRIVLHKTQTIQDLITMHVSRAMAQTVSRWPISAESRVRARVTLCGFCGGRSALGTFFSEFFGFLC